MSINQAESGDFKAPGVNLDSVAAGTTFQATWGFKNTGTTAWDKDYRFVYTLAPHPETAAFPRKPLSSQTTWPLSQSVKPGEIVTVTVSFTAPSEAGTHATNWQLQVPDGQRFGPVRWMRLIVAGMARPLEEVEAVSPTAPSSQTIKFGMNVNINDGHPMDAERMNGLGWVRFVYWASREEQSPEEAYQQTYRHIIQTYANQGIGSLIILHQDTYWGNAPWDNGDWDGYAQKFAEACGRVARVCAEFGDKIAYQIHNEQDSGFGNDAGNPNHSAIGIAPANYAKILQPAAAAIKQAHPAAPVIFGGLKTGPGNALEYVRQVQRTLGGKLPVDALAYHPYGRYVNLALFNYGSIGKLADALNMFKQAYPQIPLWITEVGAAADIHIGPEHYANIATYLREFVDELANNYADYVQALIWFGWTDIMRNSGINTVDNKPKTHVFDAFAAMRDHYK